MKYTAIILAAIILTGVVAGAGVIAWLMFDLSREWSPKTYMEWLDSDPAVFAHVDSVAESRLRDHAYAYESNEYTNAFPAADRLPKTADANGHVPSFKLEDDIFIITSKWVNSSAGLAISDASDFITRIESLDPGFRVRHLAGNIYRWDLDLEAPAGQEQ